MSKNNIICSKLFTKNKKYQVLFFQEKCVEILQKEWNQGYDPGPNIKEAGCNVIQACAKKIVTSMHSLQKGSGSYSPEQLQGNFKEKYKVNYKTRMPSSRMRTARSLTVSRSNPRDGGQGSARHPGMQIALNTDTPGCKPPDADPPRMQTPHPCEQTGEKILPNPNLRLRAVMKDYKRLFFSLATTSVAYPTIAGTGSLVAMIAH